MPSFKGLLQTCLLQIVFYIALYVVAIAPHLALRRHLGFISSRCKTNRETKHMVFFIHLRFSIFFKSCPNKGSSNAVIAPSLVFVCIFPWIRNPSPSFFCICCTLCTVIQVGRASTRVIWIHISLFKEESRRNPHKSRPIPKDV